MLPHCAGCWSREGGGECRCCLCSVWDFCQDAQYTRARKGLRHRRASWAPSGQGSDFSHQQCWTQELQLLGRAHATGPMPFYLLRVAHPVPQEIGGCCRKEDPQISTRLRHARVAIVL